MRAIPAAAVVSLRRAADSAQNGPIIENTADKARQRNTTVAAVEFTNPAAHAAAVPAKANPARCQRRSLVRSECIPTSTMTTAAVRYGMVDNSPMAKLPAAETPRIILGRK